MVKEAVTKAMTDAKINYRQIEQACVGYVFGKEKKNHSKQNKN